MNDDTVESSNSSGQPLSEEFLRLFTRDQFRIAGFVRAMVVDPADASDVLQETSLALWRSFDQYDPQREFASWALGVARHQVLKHWRTKRRDRLVFSETLISELADDVTSLLENDQRRYLALRECVSMLTARQRDLVRDFYGGGVTATEMAQRWNRNVHAVYNALRQVRKELQKCVGAKLGET